jgi:xylulokinase
MLLGYDIGSSSIKASLINADTGTVAGSATWPAEEMPMISHEKGWAEQEPESWWKNLKTATSLLLQQTGIPGKSIRAIGISYQMHGLVLVDKNRQVLRPSIIWCDSRAVATGEQAFKDLGADYCLGHLLNSPGNFTASKLKWVKDHEPETYEKIYKAMLPGDYIAMKLTGEINTTISGLSEGIFWDFKDNTIAFKLLEYYGIDSHLLPEIVPTFSVQGKLTSPAAAALGISPDIPIAYRAGDQPNNAFSLNVLEKGEVAATAGTSGVIYGVFDTPEYDPLSRVNTFIHVNHTEKAGRYGVLLCVNGTGIQNSWLRAHTGDKDLSYEAMNALAGDIPVGADGLTVLPFGNGAERMLENKDIGAQIIGLNFNRHGRGHLYRAAQEGIVFALNYGFDVMKNMGMELKTIRAGKANMFLSPVFCEAFANTTGVQVELYNTDGAQGAARGAGVGAGIYGNFREAFLGLKTVETINPDTSREALYSEAYHRWHETLKKVLKNA